MKKLLAIAILIAGTMVMVSCGDDDESAPTFDQPNVTATSSSDVANGGTGTASFQVTIDADLTEPATWVLTSSANITATIGGETSGTIDESGSVPVDITASTTAGPATITLEVTNPSQDPAGLSDEATAVFSVLGATDNPVTISQIPSNATIPFGSDLANVPYQVDGLDGIATFTVAVNDGTTASMADFVDPAVTLDGSETSISGTFTFDWATLLAVGGQVGSNEVVFTSTDLNGTSASFTHILVVEEAVEPTFTVQRDEFASESVYIVTGTINQDVTFADTSTYVLNGRVIVGANATLTIEPGVIVKGTTGDGALASVLLVARDGNLVADGTAAAPIIFTSVEDDIAIGEQESTLDTDVAIGLWGGVIVLGNAPVNDNSEVSAIEGIPSTVEEGQYGGSDAADNSGIINYVSIRFTGTQLAPGEEIQGLTIGGVGTGTDLSWIESMNSDDDGIEIFGGSADIDNLLIWAQADDGFDTDQGWTGTVTNLVYIGAVNGQQGWDGNSCFELDGPEGTAAGEQGAFAGGTVFVNDPRDFQIQCKSGDSRYAFSNLYFTSWDETNAPDAIINIDGDAAIAAVVNGNTTFTNIEHSTSAAAADLYSATTSADAASTDGQTQFVAGVTTGVATPTAGVGADFAAFAWTFAEIVLGDLDAL